MTNSEQEKIALFRYTIISPLISNLDDSKSKQEYFKSASEKSYVDPYGKTVTVSSGTVERWYYNYRKYGFDSLKPKKRKDLGCQRKIDSDLGYIINHYIDTHPRLPATAIRQCLIENGDIINNEVSLSTITRYINNYKNNKLIISNNEMRRYEAEHINDIWCCDTSYSFKLTIKNKKDNTYEKMRTYIIAIIDDASRMIVGCNVFFNDNYINYMSVLKDAVKKYGKPKLLNVDNGAPYKNGQIELLSARLGIVLHHCAPFSPTQKSKIERWFRTMKDHFMASYHLTTKTTIEEYREDLLKYVNNYNNSIHSSLNGKSPIERFFNGDDKVIYIDDDKIEKSFLIEVDRKVTADGLISLDTKEFEVPYQYQNKKIKVRYSPNYQTVYVVEPDNELTPIKIVDKVANSKIKRNKINFNTEEE